MPLRINGLHVLFGIKCKLCDNPLPHSPDYVDLGGKDVPICKDCGDVLDAMNTMKTGDDSWMTSE